MNTGMSIAKTYMETRQKIDEIALRCGRKPEEIVLVAVSKNHPWEAIASAYAAGCRDIGENRLQEALEKLPNSPSDLNWHFIGTLQRNKVRKAVGSFCLIHSVDTPELAEKISSVSVETAVETSILLQLNTSQESTKHGLTGEEWLLHLERISQLSHLKMMGLMTIAPNVDDSDAIRRSFQELRLWKERYEGALQRDLPHLSMGMSHDYPIAIEEGATLLRIGTAIFGERN